MLIYWISISKTPPNALRLPGYLKTIKNRSKTE